MTEAGCYYEYTEETRKSQLVFLSGEQYQALVKECTTPLVATASCWNAAGLGNVQFEDYPYG